MAWGVAVAAAAAAAAAVLNSRCRSSNGGVVVAVAVVAFANRVGFAGKYLHRSRTAIRPAGGGGGRGGRRGRRCGSASGRRCAGRRVGAGGRGGPCAGDPSSTPPTPPMWMSPALRRYLAVVDRICWTPMGFSVAIFQMDHISIYLSMDFFRKYY